jgi:polar amino acid transport system substrate-binding protein
MALLVAPTGSLRVGIWTVPFFARAHGAELVGLVPDLGTELARRLGVPAELRGYAGPDGLLAAFRDGELDVTFVGMTADRAQAIDFGPVMFEIATTYLVPAASDVASISEIDRPGMRIAVPAPSAQQAHLKSHIAHATLLAVAPESPQAAIDLLAAGEADAFSHVAPMLAAVQRALPGSRILPGSYYDVPIAIGVAKGRSPAAMDVAHTFAADVKASGFLKAAIARSGAVGIRAAAE